MRDGASAQYLSTAIAYHMLELRHNSAVAAVSSFTVLVRMCVCVLFVYVAGYLDELDRGLV